MKNTLNKSDNIFDIYSDIIDEFRRNNVIISGIYKVGLLGSFNDNEFSKKWSDLDILLILKSDELGNIDRNVLTELRKINLFFSNKYKDLEISFLTHTYNDFEKYVAYAYMDHYKYANFDIENDDIDFVSYVDNLLNSRNLSMNIKKRYSVYHLRHFRFNLIRKVVSEKTPKKAVKMIVDKIIECMIIYLTYNNMTIQGKENRLKVLKRIIKDKNIIEIFQKALLIRSKWCESEFVDEDIDIWLKNFKEIEIYILRDNLYSTPEELINNNL